MSETFGYNPQTAHNVPHLYTLVRGAETIRWTDHYEAITIAGDTWTPEPDAQLSSVDFKTDGSVSTCVAQLSARPNGPLSDVDIALGRYDGYPIQIVTVDSANIQPSPSPYGPIFTGYVGTVNTSVAKRISIYCRGPLTRLRQDITEKYPTMCLADLGDRFDPTLRGHCAAPIMPPDIQRSTTYPAGDEVLSFVRVPVSGIESGPDYQNLYWEVTTAGTTAGTMPDYADKSPGDTVTDGNAVLTARNAWLRSQEVDTIETPMAFTMADQADPREDEIPNYYALGSVIIRSGRYEGQMIPIRSYDEGSLLVRCWFLIGHMIEPGTKIEIHPGCPKTEAGCTMFGQIKNRQAFTFAPGRDAAMAQA